MTFDSYGNAQTTRMNSHPAISYPFDFVGRMESLTDQVNSQTSFQYDKRSLLKKRIDPLLKETNFYYDDAGRIDYRTDRNNHTVDYYTLTPTGKPEWISYPSGPWVHFIYNQLDQLQTMQDGIGNTVYTYWPTGRLQSVTNPYGFVVSYDYDEAGNLKELTYPGNKKVIYTYDDLNRLGTVRIDWLNQTATYHYDLAGRLTRIDNFNGTFTDISGPSDYDNANRLKAFANKKSNGTIISSYQFTLDGNGNRTQIIQDEPLAPALGTGVTSYGYNPQRNRLISAGANSFGYDDEGQLNTGYGVSYSFDYEHRLIGTPYYAGYNYDGIGNRLQAARMEGITRYIYDAAGNLLAEADGNNYILRYYIYGNGLLAMVTPSNQVYCYHFNAVGSTIAMTDQSQTVINKYAYDPFGSILGEEVAFFQPFKFVGQFGVMAEPNTYPQNPYSKLYYMRARYYDPEVGRFISEDPIGLDGGDVNLMAYVGNNPVNYSDPLGRYQCTYSVSSHTMICIPNNLIFPTFESNKFVSGNNNFPGPINNIQNNPAFEGLRDHGPIPQGSYNIGPQRLNSSRRDLTPDPSNVMYDRYGFQTHGCGNPASCSAGCIAARTNQTRDTLNRILSYEEGRNTLYVKP